MSKFQKVLKSTTTREAIVAAVAQRAVKIAKRDGIGDDLALAKAWAEHPEAQLAYESAPKEAPKKPERRMFAATKAEIELDDRARKLMKKNPGTTYAKAVTQTLESDPGLYSRYESELAQAKTYDVPEPESQRDHPMYKSASDGDECPACGEEVDDDAKFCSACGADLAKAKRKRSA